MAMVTETRIKTATILVSTLAARLVRPLQAIRNWPPYTETFHNAQKMNSVSMRFKTQMP